MTKYFKLGGAKFLEASGPEGKDWKVCLIETGTSKNGFTYPAETLQKAAPLFEDVKACLYEFDNKILKHLPDFIQETIRAGFPKSIVGWYSNVHFGEFKDAQGNTHTGILGDFHIAENAKWLRDLMKDAWDNGKNLLGLSIDAGGLISEAKEDGLIKRIVQEITKVNSVDVVTYPSAGGEFLRLVAALDEEPPRKLKLEETMKKHLVKLYEMLLGKKSDAVKGIDPKNISEEQGAVLFTEAMTLDAAATLKIVEAGVKEDVIAGTEAEKAAAQKLADEDKAKAEKAASDKLAADKMTENEKTAAAVKESLNETKKIQEAMLKTNCASLLKAELAESKLPIPLQESISKRFAGKVYEAKELNDTIVESKNMLAKLSESGEIRDMGNKIEVTLMEADKKQAALDKLIDPKASVNEKVKGVGAFRGIKEAYVAFTGDHDVSGQMSPKRLTESMQSSDFPLALGVSMNRRMAKEYPLLPTTWQNIATVSPLSNFKTQEIIRYGGFGRLPVVAEKGSYTDLQGPRDERATYAPTKKGGMAYITREMIKNDDMRTLQRLPTSLVRAAAETLEYYVWNPILANSACYDGTALGSIAHGNYATGALDNATLTAAKLRMRKQRGEGSVLHAGTANGTYAVTTMEDSTAHFGSSQECAGKYVRFVYGTGAGQQALIASHTDTVLTFATVLVAPDATTKYQVSAASAADLRMGLKAKYLIGGPDLEAVANVLLQSEKIPGYANNDVNVHKGTLEFLSPLYLSDATDWFLAADPALIDLIEVGFIDGQQNPELMLQDQPANGVVFSNDQIAYKIRHEYGMAIPDFRGWDVNIVAG